MSIEIETHDLVYVEQNGHDVFWSCSCGFHGRVASTPNNRKVGLTEIAGRNHARHATRAIAAGKINP